MAKKSKSKRNRHTGRINAFKASIMRQGHVTKEDGVLFLKGYAGADKAKPTGVTLVRVKR